MSRTQLERDRQSLIMIAIGAEPDLLILRNSIGKAEYYKDTGAKYYVPYGLGEGTPDLVCLLKVHNRAHWFCLECKTDEGGLTEKQLKMHALWVSFGAFVATVLSPQDAIDALKRAREYFK